MSASLVVNFLRKSDNYRIMFLGDSHKSVVHSKILSVSLRQNLFLFVCKKANLFFIFYELHVKTVQKLRRELCFDILLFFSSLKNHNPFLSFNVYPHTSRAIFILENPWLLEGGLKTSFVSLYLPRPPLSLHNIIHWDLNSYVHSKVQDRVKYWLKRSPRRPIAPAGREESQNKGVTSGAVLTKHL